MKRAFIVDDEVSCISILSSLVERHQIPMTLSGSAHSGDTALMMIRQLRPDIVFMDIEIPGMNGLEVIRRLRQDQGLTTRFIIISAYDNFRYAQEALRLGVTDFLLKPLDSSEFLEMVQRLYGFPFTSNQSFNEILAYLNDHYAEDLALNDCSARFHMSTHHITRLFRKYLGTGFTSYKNKVRIDHAKRLLSETDKTIKEVCETVGYQNMNYFYRQFREATGLTPKEYQDNGAI